MIKIDNLTKRFGQFTAVDGLSFTVQPGEVLGFLGPNGAGKSTTMKMITGFLTPSSGQVSIMGVDIAAEPLKAKQRVGYLPEGAPSYGDMKVLQFLRFIAQVRGFKGVAMEERVARVQQSLHLEKVLHQPIDTLSKGFKRRVGLAQAIIHDPQVLILDEPTDGLDPNQKQEVRNLIANLSKDKILIISTHILEEVSAVCTRAIIIAAGRIVADETPDALIRRSRYHNAVTLRLTTPATLPEAAAALRGLDGVDHVETDERACSITAFPAGGAVIVTAVADLAGRNNWPLEQLHLESGRMDEVFRSITEQEAGR